MEEAAGNVISLQSHFSKGPQSLPDELVAAVLIDRFLAGYDRATALRISDLVTGRQIRRPLGDLGR